MTDDCMIPVERIEHAIYEIRGQRAMMDVDLAALYGVETGALVRAVKRNLDRFPADFTFQLTTDEFRILRCQFGISSRWGGRRFLPYAFTEQGVAMLSSVLHSKQAIRVDVLKETIREVELVQKRLAGRGKTTRWVTVPH